MALHSISGYEIKPIEVADSEVKKYLSLYQYEIFPFINTFVKKYTKCDEKSLLNNSLTKF